MDQFLASYYGTGQAPGLEKVASEDRPESDFLGRVMAHAFNQELGEIEKWAADPGLEAAAERARRYKEQSEAAQETINKREAGRAKDSAPKTPPPSKTPPPPPPPPPAKTPKKEEIGRVRKAIESMKGTGSRAWKAATKTRTRQGLLAAGGVTALGAGGYGGYRALKKKSADEEFQELVEQRAYEHLEAAGLLEKQASYDDFEEIVDTAALGLLEANGYPVEWY